VATFLQVLGLIFLAAILLVLGGLLVLGLKVRGALRTLKETAGQFASAFQPQPATIHLDGPKAVDWKKPADVDALAGPLASLGYHDAGQFAVEEIDGLALWAFVNPSESAYAIVYEHPAGLVWMDFVTRYQDGTKLTVTNSDQGEPLDKPPGDEKVYVAGATTVELHRRHRTERSDQPKEPVSAAAFREVFERAYADEMAWRNSRGGPTEQEIRAIAARSGMTVSDEEVEATREAMAWQAIAGLDEALRDRFTESANLPPREWERVRDRLVFVHDRLTPEMLADRLGEWLADDEDEEGPEVSEDDFPDDLPAREAFLRYNASLPTSRRFVKIGELDEPIAADVYRAAD
jgi:hypothetical protein